MSWRNLQPYRISVEHNSDFSRYRAIVRVVHRPNLKRWSLVSGDAIHNLRCSLDHLIYSIAILRAQRNPPPRRRAWFFPIRDDRDSFQRTIANNPFSKLGATVLEEIEQFQPYNRPHPRLPPMLMLLRRFDDSDKHRILRVATPVLWNVGWEWTKIPGSGAPKMDISQMNPPGTEVVDDAKVGELTFPGPSREAHPKFTAHSVVSISTSLSQKPFELPDVLSELAREVRTIIERVSSLVWAPNREGQ